MHDATPRRLAALVAAAALAGSAAGCDELPTAAESPAPAPADADAAGSAAATGSGTAAGSARSATSAGAAPSADAHEIRVMTRNLYVGAPVEALFDPELGPGTLPAAAAELWAAVRASDFPSRAAALAGEIERARPHLIGLQEVSVFKVQLVSDLVFGGTEPASDVALDFLGELLDALEARGLDYRPVATATNFAAEVPFANPASPLGLSDVRLEDFDVILARSDVDRALPRSARFAARASFELGGATLELPRGWAAVDATVAGRTFTFVNTHLEPAESGDALQLAQAEELVAAFEDAPHPLVLVGDLNSEADGGSTPTYGFLRSEGFEDAWTRGSAGFTCCHAPDLRNRRVAFSKRIDFVLVRGDLGFGGRGLRGAARAEVVGSRHPDRTPSGLWPSDHGGVAVTFRLPPGSR